MSRSGLTHPRRDMRLSNENVQLLGGNFYRRIFNSARIKFSPRMLSRFCFPTGFSPGSWRRVFSWRDPGEYRFLGGILAEIRGGNFSREGSRRENGPPRRDPGGIPVSAGNLGGIPARSRYLFYKGTASKRSIFGLKRGKMAQCVSNRCKDLIKRKKDFGDMGTLSLHTRQVDYQAGTHPSFCSMK